jgi:bifunctional non-homologous end joining protein LigD
MLGQRLEPLHRTDSPFGTSIPPEDARFARWVEPVLVAEVTFADWTKSGRLRAPAYKGLRDDKDATEVIREP